MTDFSVPTVAIVANSAWNLLNFRRPLISGLQDHGCRVILLAPAGPEQLTLEATGATFIPLVNLRRKGQNPLRDAALVWELVRIYRRKKVSVALHFTIKPVIYGSLAARWANVRNVSTLTGLGYTFLSGQQVNQMVRWLYRWSLRSASTVFFHNPDDLDLFVGAGLAPADRCRVVPGSGLLVADYPLISYEKAVPGRFLFVGRLLVDKGIREYVAAARRARVVDPSLSFHILGPLDSGNPTGITVEELEAWVAEGIVTYAGVAQDVRPYLQQAAVVVLPSYREGCPRVLLEAAAMGRALIGADVPGVREVVIPGENGWLVPVKSTAALAEACLAAAATPAHLIPLGEAGSALVAKKFSAKIVVGQYLKEVSRTISNELC